MSEKIEWNELTQSYDNGKSIEEVYEFLHAGSLYGQDHTSHGRGSEYMTKGYDSVCDVGAGRCLWAKQAAPPEKFAIDISPAACKWLREMGIEPFCIDMTRVPWKLHRTFDVVGCFDVLEHIPPEHVAKVLQELRAITAHRLILSIHNGPSKSATHEALHLTIQPDEWWGDQIAMDIGPPRREGRGRSGVFWVIDL